MGKTHFDFMLVRGVWRDRAYVEKHMVCRKCRAGVGKPYIHHISGEVDHERMTCHGPARHEIHDEGDVMFKKQHQSLADESADRKFAVALDYGLIDRNPDGASQSLYGDGSFEGFG